MNKLQTIADKTAISLSFLCTLHCLAVPFAMALLPTLAAINLGDEVFHFWMIIAVIPTSLLALSMGCKKHNDYRVLLLGIAGLSLLIIAAFFQLFDGMQAVVLGALKGMQDVKIPTLITFVAYWVIAFPVCYFTGIELGYGSPGIWWGFLVGLGVSALLLLWRFQWITKRELK